VTDEACGGWRTAAACAALGPSLFYDSRPAAVCRAKALCDACAVRQECGSHAAVAREFGVWGGLTEAEREYVVRSKPGPPPTVNDDELVALFTSCDSTVRATTLLRRRAALSRRIIYKYLSRAQTLGLIKRRGAYLYPVRR
jgi:Transcription factor WhiB